MVDIRKSLKDGLASLLSHRKTRTESDIFYQGFPTTLDGAGVVEKYETKGSQHCLVHVRQSHHIRPPISAQRARDNPSMVEKATNDFLAACGIKPIKGTVIRPEVYRAIVRDLLKKVCSVQKDISRILYSLKLSHDIDRVRAEAVTGDFLEFHARSYISNTVYPFVKRGFLKSEETFRSSEYGLLAGAHFYALLNNVINKIQRTEDSEVFEKTLREMTQAQMNGPIDRAVANKIQRVRDHKVLELISQDKEPYSVLIFGAKHNFVERVLDWNSENPRDRFSLIVVTPKSYK